MAKEYATEILNAGGTLPKDYAEDERPMQIAKLHDVWRKYYR